MGLGGGALPRETAVKPRSIDPVVGWVDLPPEGCTKPVPRLKECPKVIQVDGDWSDQAKQHWIELWQSPQATQWNRTNTDPILRYVYMHEYGRRYGWQGPYLTAVAQIEEKHGLTPYAMRRMFWRIKPTDEVPAMSHLAPVQSIKGEDLR